MGLTDLCNTTIQIKSASRGELNNQPIETIGDAGTAMPARIEHIEDIPMDMGGGGLMVQSIYLFYIPGTPTIKERDLISCDSVDYRVLSIADAYGMSTIDHVEARAVKVL